VTCITARNLLHAFLDGELDLVRHLEIEHHLQDCKSCSEIHESQLNLRAALRSDAFYHLAPAGLRERVTASLADSIGVMPRRIRIPWRWGAVAAAAACLALVSWMAGRISLGFAERSERRLADAVLVGHVRSLLGSHLTDVASNDRHEVKPWFTGKLDYSFTVPNLDAAGFPLTGGRLDYLTDRTVAALVYQRNKHAINLFLWPATEERDTSSQSLSSQGYQFVHWVKGKMEYWAVSDLNERELLEFAELVRGNKGN